ncbi:corrinoid protein-associated methyltransferase CpaM [Actinocrispum wychmicini]|uniref:Demethylmenaquinone methyltransferase/2-methoxy-6-polyprenyl-1,4-benzoquinol methylase n=1 Tax=Actinocrispum wychmicini TaxID=1213861 RepID=A0A4R2JL48_9PSEU|nr:corrinoid protein-associated methyltransferase CpaM [Actinocrispum wychmicini]TCO59292.1 demethylmenaquinone methyltransferase/2-methoxy-6-polyprenyl-1,4-benzoquinol methylase [Actinocrispum wychmicini]
MSSFVFMKLLETSSTRYDLGMRVLSGGRITQLYRDVTAQVPARGRILEVGCGTGGVTAELVSPSREIVAVDRSPQMLAVAERKLAASITQGRVRLQPVSITGLERVFGAESFDAVVCCLVLSELTETEECYALDVFCGLLRPGGVLVVADEVVPERRLRRWAYRAQRFPMAALTYVLTQTTTHAAHGLEGKVTDRGLQDVAATRSHGQSFQIVQGRKPACRLQPQP